MKTCPQCEKTYPDSEQFCASDGAALVRAGAVSPPGSSAERVRECPVCGGKAEPGEAICNFCGARLDSPAGSPPETKPPTPRSTQQSFETEERTDESAEEEGGRSIYGTIGYVVAALVALAAGIWLALRVSGTTGKPQVAMATATPMASPAVTGGPMVTLAKTVGLQVTGESASAPGRDKTAAQKVFDDHAPDLLDFYKRSLANDATVHDGMIVRLRVTPDGSVIAGTVRTSTSPNPGLDAAVVGKMTGWKFSPFGGTEVEADYPIVFARNAADRDQIESALSDKVANLSTTEPPEYAWAEGVPSPAPSPAVAMAPAPVALPPPPSEAPPPPRRKPKRVASRPKPTPALYELVKQKLQSNPKFHRVKAYTSDGGTVTLFGKVFDDTTRLAAEHTVKRVPGVTAVNNTITTDTADWAACQSQIQRELQNAGLGKVTVKVIGSSAYLDGEVSTDLEKQRAETITVAACRVKVGTNLIRVVPPGVFGF